MTNKPCENHIMLLTQVKCGVRIMLKAEDNRGIRERDDEGMAGEKYRYHKIYGTIHFIPGCCGHANTIKPGCKKENFGECFTYEEAVERLKVSNVIGKKCTVCKWKKGE